jgi:hypothetical protein
MPTTPRETLAPDDADKTLKFLPQATEVESYEAFLAPGNFCLASLRAIE